MSQDQTERKGTQVVHVREDSGSELDALFNAVMNPKSGQSGQIPLRMRNLPASFWKPPDQPQRPVQHMKQGSNDSTGGYPGHPSGVGPSQGNLQIAHMRAHSSPASLQQTLSTVPQGPPQAPAHHARQHSCDALLDNEPLPPGWEIAKMPDGQRYYLKQNPPPDIFNKASSPNSNHLTQSTTWQDPRKAVSTTALNSQQSPPSSQQSPNVSMQNLNLDSLPQGWEQASTPEGDIYYINHHERTTSWYDPRIPERMRQQARINSVGPGPGQRQMGQQLAPPPQHPQQNGGTQRSQQANLQFSKLQMEKERLRKRQEEIARQEMLLRAQMQAQQQLQQQQQQQQQDAIPVSQSINISQANEMTSVTDPFLGQTNSSDHSRQESTDSGVGGMGTGTNYSMPRTPEDFLSNVDEMDTQEGGHRQGDFNNMDIGGNIGESGEPSNMDSEDLVPSLQEDISNELLNDMENVLNSNKLEDNLLTWL
ncbi:transcriptional coactivator YAP1-like isoform X2 [Mizuhopecten yessoensis]|uniref:transcriptional coactivator YAP1-like isoform X2 n=1 Tax=Mizuhopecten yessoensis TaxID=6573 RepID=UPI000B45C497|nr:transcriptional coactivator YAP1-like isoform X2 [Mizuhopecten yessoensis]